MIIDNDVQWHIVGIDLTITYFHDAMVTVGNIYLVIIQRPVMESSLQTLPLKRARWRLTSLTSSPKPRRPT